MQRRRVSAVVASSAYGAVLGARMPADSPVDARRVRVWNESPLTKSDAARGPVVYWMSRDQRVQDNWALVHAQRVAASRRAPLVVAFNLVHAFLGAPERAFRFMLDGLADVQRALHALDIGFVLLRGQPGETVARLCRELDASLLVTDFSPLRIATQWRVEVCRALSCAMHEVDAHNIVPPWVAAPNQLFMAVHLRPRIARALDEWLVEIPPIGKHATPLDASVRETLAHVGSVAPLDVGALLDSLEGLDRSVPPVDKFAPGEKAAAAALQGFISKRLAGYATKRNDPSANHLSHLSPYLHFGMLGAQRTALAMQPHRKSRREDVEAFLEEMVVRRELSDNYCFYNAQYDSFDGLPNWARVTLTEHAGDKREYVYTDEQFERAQTHDRLWNAAQLEMVHMGKMHGYLRMYWAKKILEWSSSPRDAIRVAIWLNDKYELDGRDPNGYVGCLWSIGGVHDRGWTERPVFGKIRYMNYEGCRRKFDVEAYIRRVGAEVHAVKQAARAAAAQ